MFDAKRIATRITLIRQLLAIILVICAVCFNPSKGKGTNQTGMNQVWEDVKYFVSTPLRNKVPV